MYEDIVRKVGGIIAQSIKIPEKEKEKYLAVLEVLGLDVTPEEIYSAALILMTISLVLGSLFFALTFSLPVFLTFVIVGAISFYYIKNYPFILLNRISMEKSGELMMAIFFMVTYMRMNPNLEKALQFAAENLSGPLGKELKKLLWDLENRVIPSAMDALDELARRWEEKVPEFKDAIRLIEASVYETSESRRLELLDRAVERMIDGSFERANRFAIRLKQPVNTIYMLGIILPILVTILVPVAMLFASDIFKIDQLFLFYDIILPGIIFVLAQKILSKRPVFFIRYVKSHPTWPKEDHIRIFGKEVNIFAIMGTIAFFTIILPSIQFIATFQGYPSSYHLYLSFLPILAFSVGVYLLLSKYISEREDVIEEIRRTEKEFVDIGFQLGSRIAEGFPPEIAFVKIAEKTHSKFLLQVVERIRKLGLDIRDALFHPKYGVLRYYRSPILASGMKVLLEASKKSFREAASVMVAFSRHLKNMEALEAKIEDLLGETLGSMRFNVKFVFPILLSVVVGITGLLSIIMWNIKEQIAVVSAYSVDIETSFAGGFLMGLLKITEELPLPVFQMIVGVYFIEVVFLISYLIAEIEQPGSKYYFYKVFKDLLLTSSFLYCILGFFSSFFFIGLARYALRLTMGGGL